MKLLPVRHCQWWCFLCNHNSSIFEKISKYSPKPAQSFDFSFTDGCRHSLWYFSRPYTLTAIYTTNLDSSSVLGGITNKIKKQVWQPTESLHLSVNGVLVVVSNMWTLSFVSGTRVAPVVLPLCNLLISQLQFGLQVMLKRKRKVNFRRVQIPHWWTSPPS